MKRLAKHLALALTGWYLMTPPVYGHDYKRCDLDLYAKLSLWQIEQAFDTADTCEEIRVYENDKVKADPTADKCFKDVTLFEQCVETTDPRLAR